MTRHDPPRPSHDPLGHPRAPQSEGPPTHAPRPRTGLILPLQFIPILSLPIPLSLRSGLTSSRTHPSRTQPASRPSLRRRSPPTFAAGARLPELPEPARLSLSKPARTRVPPAFASEQAVLSLAGPCRAHLTRLPRCRPSQDQAAPLLAGPRRPHLAGPRRHPAAAQAASLSLCQTRSQTTSTVTTSVMGGWARLLQIPSGSMQGTGELGLVLDGSGVRRRRRAPGMEQDGSELREWSRTAT